jgi:hypothetical protein
MKDPQLVGLQYRTARGVIYLLILELMLRSGTYRQRIQVTFDQIIVKYCTIVLNRQCKAVIILQLTFWVSALELTD